MVDETTGLFNTEQIVLCLRYVNDSVEVHEELIVLHNLEVVRNIVLRMNLAIINSHGQC